MKVYWYGVAYAASFLLAWQFIRRWVGRYSLFLRPHHIDDLLVPVIIGIIIGGRLGHVILFDPLHYLHHPLEILLTWHGGMSFHGGLIGTAIALIIKCRSLHIPLRATGDAIVLGAPIGLFFGRIANFINSELIGRVTDVPWAVVFPNGGPLPRHPSQLYEALLEGPLLWFLMIFLWRKDAWRSTPGRISGAFLLGYALFRCIGELFRTPDGLFSLGILEITLGQAYCLPMASVGVYLIGSHVVCPRHSHR